jgi:small subunit ribosomal protein S26e
MAKKRKSGGRKSGKGRTVQCSKCGRNTPIDKAKKLTKRVSTVDRETERMIRKQKGYVPTTRRTFYYCVSCAVHRGIVKIRSSKERDAERPRAEQKTPTKKLTDDKIQEEIISEQRKRRKKKNVKKER